MNLLRRSLIRNKSSFPITFNRSFALLTQEVPQLGESITEGAIAEWCKEIGEAIEADDVVGKLKLLMINYY